MDRISTHAPLARCDPQGFPCKTRRCNFNSRTSCEVRRSSPASTAPHVDFNSRTSCEVRHDTVPSSRSQYDFNSRTSCEVRPWRSGVCCAVQGFQLTHLVRGATRDAQVFRAWDRRFQLTHLLRGATLASLQPHAMQTISTHAPLARCDDNRAVLPSKARISTHAPLARCDHAAEVFHLWESDFNSRTSCEVRRVCRKHYPQLRISTHAPLARCDAIALAIFAPSIISTHAPLARCDSASKKSCGVAHISTHAPLARCDTVLSQLIPLSIDFNSRTSCEVRLHAARGCAATRHFNSRTSCEVRRAGSRGQWRRTAISTHAPLARCDIFPTLGVI